MNGVEARDLSDDLLLDNFHWSKVSDKEYDLFRAELVRRLNPKPEDVQLDVEALAKWRHDNLGCPAHKGNGENSLTCKEWTDKDVVTFVEQLALLRRVSGKGAQGPATPYCSTLPRGVWCECGHISGQHGIKPPHICATGGNDGCENKCQGFKAAATLICSYCYQPIEGDAQEHVQRNCEEYKRWALSGERGLTVPEPCRYRIGQTVFWDGQIGECSGRIIDITRPENSDYVLLLDIGDGVEMPHSARDVMATPATTQGTPEGAK